MTTTSDGTVPEKGLLSRAIGVLTSPRETYAAIVARPRVFGALTLVIVLVAISTFLFLRTEVGRNALLDQFVERMEASGRTPPPEVMARLTQNAPYFAAFSVAGQIVFIPVVSAIVAGLVVAVFNAMLGGTATFKQAMAVVVHSSFVTALGVMFVMPLNYAQETMSSATSLAVFLPMLDPQSFLGMLAGSIDFFRVWWFINLAIGIGVLYKRRTSPIAWSLLALYAVIALVVAGVRAALGA
jgi:hypothetical protein